MSIKTKRMICLMIGIASVLTIVGTVSYAYFTTVGETKKQEATISTGTARVTFRDGDTGITGELSFGESLTKKFTIENTGTAEANVKMYFKDLINTYTEGSLTYTLSWSESEEGPYTEVVNKTNVPKNEENPEEPITVALSEVLTIPVGGTRYYNLVITLNYLADVNQDADINAKFSSTFSLEDSHGPKVVTSTDILAKFGETSQGVRTSFDAAATTDEGIFEMEDDYGTSYYYRGAVEDNYVKYGVNKEGQEMWWRIIRINGDGSVRMVYDGTQGYANGTSSNDRFIKINQPFNAQYNDAKYVGWMYGPANATEGTTTASTSKEQAQTNMADSDVKKVVDKWYKENIEGTGYGANVSDEIFCNDRTTPGKDLTGVSSDTGLGYGTQVTYYGAFSREGSDSSENYNNPQPIFTCPEKNDAFTVDDTKKGNGALTYPVGLITADEIIAAGSGKFGTSNTSYYLYHGIGYMWSLSPYGMNAYGGAIVFNVNTSNSLSGNDVFDTSGTVAPVINLSAEYANTLVGTGKIGDPYRAA